jgi:glycosyltransferase involved in cell wall biosynthesis
LYADCARKRKQLAGELVQNRRQAVADAGGESESPLVSVVMPCYNAAPFVDASVRSVLAQTHRRLELIVVDDNSRDRSWEILTGLGATDPRVRILRHDRNLGASRSRNDAIQIAKGEYIAFCDADDLWHPEKIERQVALLSLHRDFDITYCESALIDERGAEIGKTFSQLYPLPAKPSGDLSDNLSLTNFINMQTVLVRSSPVADYLLFDESIRWVEDWWQWIRLSRRFRFLYEPTVLAKYRIHAGSTNTTQRPGISRNRWKVFKRNLRQHPELSPAVRSEILYRMAVELAAIGYRKTARRLIRRSMRTELRHGIPGTRFAVKLLRYFKLLLS